jgi:hypothetical protein
MSQNEIMHNVSNNIDSVGSDSENLQRLLKIANSIASDNVRRKTGNNHQSSLMVDNINNELDNVVGIKSRGPQKVQTTTTNSQQVSNPIQKVITPGSDDSAIKSNEICSNDTTPGVTTLMGFSLPTSTLYFIIVCIVIAIILFYMTSHVSKEKESGENEELKESGENEELKESDNN